MVQLCGFSPSAGLLTLSEPTFSSLNDFLNLADSEVLGDFTTRQLRKDLTRVMLHHLIPAGAWCDPGDLKLLMLCWSFLLTLETRCDKLSDQAATDQTRLLKAQSRATSEAVLMNEVLRSTKLMA